MLLYTIDIVKYTPNINFDSIAIIVTIFNSS